MGEQTERAGPQAPVNTWEEFEQRLAEVGKGLAVNEFIELRDDSFDGFHDWALRIQARPNPCHPETVPLFHVAFEGITDSPAGGSAEGRAPATGTGTDRHEVLDSPACAVGRLDGVQATAIAVEFYEPDLRFGKGKHPHRSCIGLAEPDEGHREMAEMVVKVLRDAVGIVSPQFLAAGAHGAALGLGGERPPVPRPVAPLTPPHVAEIAGAIDARRVNDSGTLLTGSVDDVTIEVELYADAWDGTRVVDVRAAITDVTAPVRLILGHGRPGPMAIGTRPNHSLLHGEITVMPTDAPDRRHHLWAHAFIVDADTILERERRPGERLGNLAETDDDLVVGQIITTARSLVHEVHRLREENPAAERPSEWRYWNPAEVLQDPETPAR